MENNKLDNIETLEQAEEIIKENITPKFNRAQRRALAKKAGKKGRTQLNTITETAKKIDYIDLIEKLRDLNKKRENENYGATEN